MRTPWVDVPVATLKGLGQDSTGPEVLFESTRPFHRETLHALYPHGLSDYVAAFRTAAEAAVGAGFPLAADLDEMVAVAAASYPA